jgi:hypothetical protein
VTALKDLHLGGFTTSDRGVSAVSGRRHRLRAGPMLGTGMQRGDRSSAAPALGASPGRTGLPTISRACIAAAAFLLAGVAPAIARAGDVTDLADIADDVELVASVDTGVPTAAAIDVDVAGTIAAVRAEVTSSADPDGGSATARSTAASAPTAADTSAGVDAAPAGGSQAEPADLADTVVALADTAVETADRATSAANSTPTDTAASGAVGSPSQAKAASAKRNAPRHRLHGSSRAVATVSVSRSYSSVSVTARATAAARASSTAAGRGTGAARPKAPARRPQAPALPRDRPPVPLLPGSVLSSGGGFGSGAFVPVLLVALGAAICIFALRFLTRRVRFPRSPRPRRVSLPPWRPG